MSAADAVVIPVVEMPDHPVSPDFARENIRVPAPGASGMPAIPEARQGDGGGHPMALAEIRPYYPYSARTRGEEGKVTVHLRVTSGGSVDSVEIGRSSGFSVLDQSALAAARKARFKPAEHNGLPIAADMDLQFDFRLEN